MTVYFLAYLTILVISVLLVRRQKGHTMLITGIAWLICLLIASFRAETVGVDTRGYLEIFRLFQSNIDVSMLSALHGLNTIEMGYLHFANWISHISSNQVVFFLIQYAIIYAGLFHYIRKYSVNVPCSLLLFMAIPFTSTLNIMRQYLMFALALYALDFFQNKRWIWAVLLFAAAYAIHRSALLLIPAFVVYFIPSKSKYLFWWLLASLAGCFILTTPSFLYPLLKIIGYSRYAVDSRYAASDSGGLMAFIYLSICVAAFVMYLLRRKWADETYAFYFILSFVGAIFTLFANHAEIFARAGSNYIFFITLLIPLVIEKYFSPNTRRLILGVMYGLLLFATYITARSYEYIPYFG